MVASAAMNAAAKKKVIAASRVMQVPVGAEHTLKCHFCDRRKPRTGFRLLANRHINLCPECWPKLEPHMMLLDDTQDRIFEQAVRMAISLIRVRLTSTGKMPTPRALVETMDDLA